MKGMVNNVGKKGKVGKSKRIRIGKARPKKGVTGKEKQERKGQG
jgi:hypothetical protein